VLVRVSAAAREALLALAIGLSCGLGAALFLTLLELATSYRDGQRWIVFALPAAGVLLGLVYERYGERAGLGTNLVIDTLLHGGPYLPRRLAPMVVLGTLTTHLFGGSAGREGTAVQMGASLAESWSRTIDPASPMRRRLLRAGVAGGFGAVFGTPVAGAIFALELPIIGTLSAEALPACLLAATVGDQVTRATGVEHTPFPTVDAHAMDALALLRLLPLALCVAAVAVAFVRLTATLKRGLVRLSSRLPVRMLVGGIALIVSWRLSSGDRLLGLGVPTIVAAFHERGLSPLLWLGKLWFTAITIASGYIGGEVTPLFFMGATLGNALAPLLQLPLDVCAAVGLVAMFGCIAKTPLALTMMAVELFGASIAPSAALVCTLAFVLTGTHGIYAQRRSTDLV
jgi:H+/Cl- antiporter ClcA